VLALARPSVRWTLVDSVGKKVRAVRGFVEALGLTSVTTIQARAEDLGRGDQRHSQDLVVARACAALPVLAEYALPLLRPGGLLLAWKGSIGQAELAAGAAAARLLGGGPPEVRSAGLAALGDHRFVLVPKVSSTPARYPRRPGEPARHPLA
jgi:16S rRNA (guanine527-N7)-methyltransferase